MTPKPLDAVCSRPHANKVADALCGAPDIRGLTDLLRAIGLGDPALRRSAVNVNSSSLVARRSTPLNPRVVTFQDNQATLADFVAVGFVRGEQFVELAAYDTDRSTIGFYLLSFEQACNSAPSGCGLSDLQSEKIEANWTGWTLSEDVDLAGRPNDCLVCHQPQGPGTEKLFRMQELRVPWMHWFPGGVQKLNFGDPASPLTDTEQVMLPIFREAHGHEANYGGIPLGELLDMDRQAAGRLEDFLGNYWKMKGSIPAIYSSDSLQDFEFDSSAVLEQKQVNRRDRWTTYFEEMRTGRRVSVPFYDVDPSDPEKRRRAVAAYLAVEAKTAAPDTMIDLTDIFSTAAEEAMGFRPTGEESPAQLLTQFCGRCHNPRLDQSLTRARFDVERLGQMSTEELELAVTRISLPKDSPYVMPPVFAAELSDTAIERLKTVLTR